MRIQSKLSKLVNMRIQSKLSKIVNINRGYTCIKNSLYIFILSCFVSVGSITGLTLGTNAYLTDANGNSVTYLNSNITQLYVNAESSYCLRNDGQADIGNYNFELIITNPQGVRVHREITFNNFLPQSPQKLSHVFEVSLANFGAINPLGFYHIKVIYSETRSNGSVILSQANDKYINYINNGTIDVSQKNNPVDLISPINDIEVFDTFPVFQWTNFQGTFPVSYTLWLSEDEDPTRNYIFKQTGIKGNLFRYPVTAQKLQAGKVYYWILKAVDSVNQPAFGIQGYTRVGSFQASDALYGRLDTVYPKDQLVSLEKEQFSWTSGVSNTFSYKVSIATDEELKNISWVGDSDRNTIEVPIQALAEAKNISVFYWKVEAYDRNRVFIGRSKTTKFNFNSRSLSVSEEIARNGKSGIKGTVKNLFSEILPNSYIVIAPEGSAGKSKNSYTLQRDEAGRYYSVTADGVVSHVSNAAGNYTIDLEPGKYEIWYYKENYVSASEVIDLKTGKYIVINPFLIPLFGSITGVITDEDTGNAVSNTVVGLRNSTVYQTVTTDQYGFYKLDTLLNGNYIMELTKYPEYKPKFVYNISIRGQRLTRNYSIQKYKTGTISGKVLRTSSTALPEVPDANLFLEAVEVDGDLLVGSTTGNAVSDVRGRFSFTDLREGRYKLYCQAPGYSQFFKYVKVDSGMTTTMQFDLSDIQYDVSGLVVDPNIDNSDTERRGLFGVSIVAANIPEFQPVLSDASGRYRLLLREGTHTLKYFMPGRAEYSRVITVTGNTILEEVPLTATASFVTMRLVSNNTNMNLQKYQVRIVPGDYKYESTTNSLAISLPANNTYKAEFILGEGVSNNYGVAPVTFRLNTGDNLVLQIPVAEYKDILGTVINEANAPIKNARVSFNATGQFTYTDALGKFKFRVPVIANNTATFTFDATHGNYLSQLDEKGNTLPTIVSFSQLSSFTIQLNSKKTYYSNLAKQRFQKEIEELKVSIASFESSIPAKFLSSMSGLSSTLPSDIEGGVRYNLSGLESLNEDLGNQKALTDEELINEFKRIIELLSTGTELSADLSNGLIDLLNSAAANGSRNFLLLVKQQLVKIQEVYAKKAENLSNRIKNDYDLISEDRDFVQALFKNDIERPLDDTLVVIDSAYKGALSSVNTSNFDELETSIHTKIREYNELREYFDSRLKAKLTAEDLRLYELSKKSNLYYVRLNQTAKTVDSDLNKILASYGNAKSKLNILQRAFQDYITIVASVQENTKDCVEVVNSILATWNKVAKEDPTIGLSNLVTASPSLFTIDTKSGKILFNNTATITLTDISLKALEKIDLKLLNSEFSAKYISQASSNTNASVESKSLAEMLANDPAWAKFWSVISQPGFVESMVVINTLLDIIPDDVKIFADASSLNWLDSLVDTVISNSATSGSHWWAKYLKAARLVNQQNTNFVDYKLTLDELSQRFPNLATDAQSEKMFISYIYEHSVLNKTETLFDSLNISKTKVVEMLYSFKDVSLLRDTDIRDYLKGNSNTYGNFISTRDEFLKDTAENLSISILKSIRSYTQSVNNAKYLLIPDFDILVNNQMLSTYNDEPTNVENIKTIAKYFKTFLTSFLTTTSVASSNTLISTLNKYYPNEAPQGYCSDEFSKICSVATELSSFDEAALKNLFYTSILKNLFPIYLITPDAPKKYEAGYAKISLNYLKINFKSALNPEDRYDLDFDLKYENSESMAQYGFQKFKTDKLKITKTGFAGGAIAIYPEMPGQCNVEPSQNGNASYTLSNGTPLRYTNGGYTTGQGVYSVDQAKQLFAANCSLNMLGYQYTLNDSTPVYFDTNTKYVIFQGKILMVNNGAFTDNKVSTTAPAGVISTTSNDENSLIKYVNIDRGAIDIVNQRVIDIKLSMDNEIVFKERKVAFYLDTVKFNASGKLQFSGYAQPTFSKGLIVFTDKKTIKLNNFTFDTSEVMDTITPTGLPEGGGQGLKKFSVGYAVLDTSAQEALGFGLTLRMNSVIYRKVSNSNQEFDFKGLFVKIPVLLPKEFEISRLRIQTNPVSGEENVVVDAPEQPVNNDILDFSFAYIIFKTIGFGAHQNKWFFATSLAVSIGKGNASFTIKDIHFLCSETIATKCFIDRLRVVIEKGLFKADFLFGLQGDYSSPTKAINAGMGAGSITFAGGLTGNGGGGGLAGGNVDSERGIEMFVWVDKTDFGFYISAKMDIDLNYLVLRQIGGGFFRSGDVFLGMLTGTIIIKPMPSVQFTGAIKMAGQAPAIEGDKPTAEMLVEVNVTATLSPAQISQNLTGGLSGMLGKYISKVKSMSGVRGGIATALRGSVGNTVGNFGTNYKNDGGVSGGLQNFGKNFFHSKLMNTTETYATSLDPSSAIGNSNNAALYVEEAKMLANGAIFNIGTAKGFIEFNDNPNVYVQGLFGFTLFGIKFAQVQGELKYTPDGRLGKPTGGMYLIGSQGYSGMLERQYILALGHNYESPWLYRGFVTQVPIFHTFGVVIGSTMTASLPVITFSIKGEMFLAIDQNDSGVLFAGGLYAGFNAGIGPMQAAGILEVGGQSGKGEISKNTNEGVVITSTSSMFRGVATFKACLLSGIMCTDTHTVKFSITPSGFDGAGDWDDVSTFDPLAMSQNSPKVNKTSLDLTLHRELPVDDERDDIVSINNNSFNQDQKINGSQKIEQIKEFGPENKPNDIPNAPPVPKVLQSSIDAQNATNAGNTSSYNSYLDSNLGNSNSSFSHSNVSSGSSSSSNSSSELERALEIQRNKIPNRPESIAPGPLNPNTSSSFGHNTNDNFDDDINNRTPGTSGSYSPTINQGQDIYNPSRNAFTTPSKQSAFKTALNAKKPLRPVDPNHGAVAGRMDYDMLLGCDVFLIPTWKNKDEAALVLPTIPSGEAMENPKVYEDALEDYKDALDQYMATLNEKRQKAAQTAQDLVDYAKAKDKATDANGSSSSSEGDSSSSTEGSSKNVSGSTTSSSSSVKIQDYTYQYKRDLIGNVYFSQLPVPTTKINYQLVILRRPEAGIWLPYNQPVDLSTPKVKYAVKLKKADKAQEQLAISLKDESGAPLEGYQVNVYEDNGKNKKFIGTDITDTNGETKYFNEGNDLFIYPSKRYLVDVYAAINTTIPVSDKNRYFVEKLSYVALQTTGRFQVADLTVRHSTVTKKGEVHTNDVLLTFDVRYAKINAANPSSSLINPLAYDRGRTDRPSYNLCFKVDDHFVKKGGIQAALKNTTQPVCSDNAFDLSLKKSGLLADGDSTIIKTIGNSTSSFEGAILPYLTQYYLSYAARTKDAEVSLQDQKKKADADSLTQSSGLLGGVVNTLAGNLNQVTSNSGGTFTAKVNTMDQTLAPIDANVATSISKVYLVIESVVDGKLISNYIIFGKDAVGNWKRVGKGQPITSTARVVAEIKITHRKARNSIVVEEDNDSSLSKATDTTIYYDPITKQFNIDDIPMVVPSAVDINFNELHTYKNDTNKTHSINRDTINAGMELPIGCVTFLDKQTMFNSFVNRREYDMYETKIN